MAIIENMKSEDAGEQFDEIMHKIDILETQAEAYFKSDISLSVPADPSRPKPNNRFMLKRETKVKSREYIIICKTH